MGGGATGTVWAAESPTYPNIVLKKGPCYKILAEAAILARLNHPNVAKVFAYLDGGPSANIGEDNDGYMAVEKLGPSLESMLSRPRRHVLLSLLCSQMACTQMLICAAATHESNGWAFLLFCTLYRHALEGKKIACPSGRSC